MDESLSSRSSQQVNEKGGAENVGYEEENASLEENMQDSDGDLSWSEDSRDSAKAASASSEDSKPFQCPICKRNFRYSHNMNKHRRIHTGEKPFHCTICDKKFSESSNLEKHRKTHTGERPYQCEVCSKCFGDSSALTIHKRVHTGEKPFKCDFCSKTFSQSGTLTLHRRTHTGEKPYQCEICGTSFAQSSRLKHHRRTHSGIRPFQCQVCSKTFNESSNLEKHRKIHSDEKPFECEICRKSYRDPSYLKAHKRIHTGERPFKCEVCHKTFRQSSDVKKHSRTHTGEKPYRCIACNKSYSTPSGLKYHNRVHRIAEEHHGYILPDNGPDIGESDDGLASQVETEDIKIVTTEECQKNEACAFDSEANRNSDNENELEDKSQVACELMSNLIDELSPVQRQICNICFNDKSDFGILFPELISRIQKCFIFESRDYLENTVKQMTRKGVGSNNLLFVIPNKKPNNVNSEFNDEMVPSYFEDSSIKLNFLARSIFEKIKPEVLVDSGDESL